MSDAYIVEALRTAGGRRNGHLSQIHPADLGAFIIDALVERSTVDANLIDDVILGCVSQVGPQTFNLARTSILSSRLPITVPGVTVDRQCGSGQQAIHFAAQAVMSGTQHMVIAGGVESMSMAPIFSPMELGDKAGMLGPTASQGIQTQYGEGETFSQFVGAELLARKYAITREELDKFAYNSHVLGAAAVEAGHFDKEIVPIEVAVEGQLINHKVDQGLRLNASLEAMQDLEPITPGGLLTAATASQICDGAAAILIVSGSMVESLGLQPLAKIHAMAVVGSDPKIVLEGPIPATRKVLSQSGLTIDDLDLYEINEAFGSVPLAWLKAMGANKDKLNVNGGAQALGHPLGATGAKLMATLVYELRRRGGKYGLLSICESMGTANATIIENLNL